MSLKKRVERLERNAEFCSEVLVGMTRKDESLGKVVDLALDKFEKEDIKRDVDALKDTHKRITLLSLLSCLLAVAGILLSFRQSR